MTIWLRVVCWISEATHAQAHARARATTPTSTPTRKHALTHAPINTGVGNNAFHGNNGFVNVPQSYVLHTLPVLLQLPEIVFPQRYEISFCVI
jgi:hypothetical protein